MPTQKNFGSAKSATKVSVQRHRSNEKNMSKLTKKEEKDFEVYIKYKYLFKNRYWEEMYKSPKLKEFRVQGLAKEFIKDAKKYFQADIKYDKKSVKWLEKNIEENRTTGSKKTPKEMMETHAVTWAAFLGECIIAEYGGKWKWDDIFKECAVFIDENIHVFPYSKVMKQIENGLGDGVVFFFVAIPFLIKHIKNKAID